MTNFAQIPGVKFICARPFDTEHGHHDIGDVVHEAATFNALESIVRAGLLYPYAPEEGYDYLPPQMFSDAQTRQEVLDRIKGDTTMAVRDPFRDKDGAKPEPMLQAEREAEIQQSSYKLTHTMDEKKMQQAADDLNAAREKEEKAASDAEKKRLKDLADGKDPIPLVIPDASAAAEARDRQEKQRADNQKKADNAAQVSAGKVSTSTTTGSSTTK